MLQLYPAYLLCNRRKTLTGSPDPTHANGTNKPCKLGDNAWDKVTLLNFPTWRLWNRSLKLFVESSDNKTFTTKFTASRITSKTLLLCSFPHNRCFFVGILCSKENHNPFTEILSDRFKMTLLAPQCS